MLCTQPTTCFVIGRCSLCLPHSAHLVEQLNTLSRHSSMSLSKPHHQFQLLLPLSCRRMSVCQSLRFLLVNCRADGCLFGLEPAPAVGPVDLAAAKLQNFVLANPTCIHSMQKLQTIIREAAGKLGGT